MYFTPAGIYTFLRCRHSLNISQCNTSTVSGIWTVSDAQPRNAPSPISRTLSGMLSRSSAPQPANASIPSSSLYGAVPEHSGLDFADIAAQLYFCQLTVDAPVWRPFISAHRKALSAKTSPPSLATLGGMRKPLECRCAEFHQPGGQCDLSQISAAIKRSCTDSPQRGEDGPRAITPSGTNISQPFSPAFCMAARMSAAASPVSIVLFIVTSSDSRGNMSLMRLSKCQTLSLQPLI